MRVGRTCYDELLTDNEPVNMTPIPVTLIARHRLWPARGHDLGKQRQQERDLRYGRRDG
jgi:hypothetical protein